MQYYRVILIEYELIEAEGTIQKEGPYYVENVQTMLQAQILAEKFWRHINIVLSENPLQRKFCKYKLEIDILPRSPISTGCRIISNTFHDSILGKKFLECEEFWEDVPSKKKVITFNTKI